MTREERETFIHVLINTVEQGIIAKADKMPEEWDGKEIRTYIAEKFSEVVWSGMELKGGAKRKYNNDVMINNL